MCTRNLFLAVAVGLLTPLLAAGSAGAATAANGSVAYECENEQSATDICLLDPDTGEVTNLTDDYAMDYWPSFSPDGTRVAYHSEDGGIHVIDTDGTGREQLVGGFDNMAFEPAWSPNGRTIAFVSTSGGSDYEIYTVPSSGETPEDPRVRLTTTTGVDDYQPTWSPDSKRLAFVSRGRTERDRCDVYAMSAVDGGNVQRLTHADLQNCSPFEDVNPSWSPVGNQIAYSSTETGNADIFVVNADGTGHRNLTNDPGWDWMPDWSPDGNEVTFTSDRDGDEEIWALDATEPALMQQLTDNETQDRASEWGADLPPMTRIATPRHTSTLSLGGLPQVTGTSEDADGVEFVRVALRQTFVTGRCRWWTGTGWVLKGCNQHVYVRASGTDAWSWTLPSARMESTSAKGVRDYRVFASGVDVNGAVETAYGYPRNVVMFKLAP
jgi:Tol biopolymer transport system component